MHRIRAELQGEHDGHVRGAQGQALLPFRAIARRPGSVRRSDLGCGVRDGCRDGICDAHV
eukprot:5947926-Prymnesium_polylepis.1